MRLEKDDCALAAPVHRMSSQGRPTSVPAKDSRRAGNQNGRKSCEHQLFLSFAAALAAASLLPVCGANAQDAYTVGVTAAMTGPASATQAPVIEMLRIYVDRLNAKGGINGHQINLLIEDDQAEPSKAAANATKLVRQENVDAADQFQLLVDLRPGDRRGQTRQGATVVCRRRLSEGDASAEARSAAVLLDRLRFQHRHSGGDQGRSRKRRKSQ